MPDTSELTVGRPTSIAKLQRRLAYYKSPDGRMEVIETMTDGLGRPPTDGEIDARIAVILDGLTTTIETMAEQAAW